MAHYRRAIAALIITPAIAFAGITATAPSADAAQHIPGWSEAQTKHAAYRAYVDYFGKNNGCKADFNHAYRGVKRQTAKDKRDAAEMPRVKLTGKAKRKGHGKVYILKVLRPYRGDCN